MASDNQPRNAITIFGGLGAPNTGGPGEPLTIDLTAIETRIEPPQSETIGAGGDGPQGIAGKPMTWERLAPLAAALVAAVLVGAFAGGVATYELARNAIPADPAAALTEETQELQHKVASLATELAALKSGVETASRNSSQQLTKIGERLERAEKAQTEPATRLAKIAESIDRLERKTTAAQGSDITGSVTTVEKQQAKPAEVDGWKLRDYYAGRALLESRSGTLFDVVTGSNVPGIGKIEAIRRVDGKIVVTTQKGVITSSLEPRRRPYYTPY